MSDDLIATTDRMFITCHKCGKKSNWVIEFATYSDDFWFQPKATCEKCLLHIEKTFGIDQR